MTLPIWLTFPVAISALSLTVALISLILTYRQKSRQDKLAARKSLTDNIAAIVAANIEFAKQPVGSEATAESRILRRHINSQRRYLVNHGAMLVSEIRELATEIDYNVLAGAFETSFDFERAATFWQKCIEASDTPAVRAMNRRGYAMFLYSQGRFEDGRRQYEASLAEAIGDGDAARRLRADTYAMWARSERDFGFIEESKRRHGQAKAEASRMANGLGREDIFNFIDSITYGEETVERTPPRIGHTETPALDISRTGASPVLDQN
jgi:tetratricopeptide (TPR) repeat protein